MDLHTYTDNMEAYKRYRIRPRILVNVADVDTSTTIYGQKVRVRALSRAYRRICSPSDPLQVDLPLGFSPTAFQGLAHPVGERGTSRAAARANIPMTLSTYSTTSIEDVVAAGSGNPYAMQLSVMKSRGANLEILQRAESELSVFLSFGSLGSKVPPSQKRDARRSG